MPVPPNQPKGRWICPSGHACAPEPAEGGGSARQGIGRRKNAEILNKKIDNLQQVKKGGFGSLCDKGLA